LFLWHEDLGALGQHPGGSLHAGPHDLFRCTVVDQRLTRGAALGRADLRVRVVDVVARAIGEHGVHQVRLDGRGQQVVDAEPARVATGVFVLEVPPDLAVCSEVGVDQERRRADRVAVGASHENAVLGLDAADLGDRHAQLLARRR
jgi:hypothetical protein